MGRLFYCVAPWDLRKRDMSEIAKNIKTIHAAVKKICDEVGRSDSPALVAVSKKQPPEKLQAALDAGHRLFGENRVQEAYEHWGTHCSQYADLTLHLIGPLQTNKVAQAVALFDVIETLDRPKLAHALAKEMKKQDRHLPCFIQVNTGEEEQKAGIAPSDLPEFLKLCQEECGLNVTGLMCIPPADDPPALHFALLHKFAKAHDLTHLSMGMSADYEKAIPLGATHIRVGTGVFGARQTT